MPGGRQSQNVRLHAGLRAGQEEAPMSTKIALTITPDTEYLAPDEIDAAMALTITTLHRLGLVPLRKIVIAIECKHEDPDDLEDTIHAPLSPRPPCIQP